MIDKNPFIAKLIATGQQLLCFVFVGGFGTFFHYIILFILVRWADTNPVIASIFGSIVGALINYILNYHWTFKCDKEHKKALPMFLTVAFSCLVLNAMIMMLAINIFNIQYILAQIIATIMVLCWNFGVNKAWTFK
jgi:putative flippase GtrA